MEMVEPLLEVVKCVWRPVTKYMCYLINPRRNFKELKEQLEELCVKKRDHQTQIHRVQRQKGPTEEYSRWLSSVEKIENDVKDMEKMHPYEKRCFREWFPDVIARVKFGEQVTEMIERVRELQEKSKFETGFLVDLPPEIVGMRAAPALKEETSADRTLQKILSYLRDEGIHRIGIWGMGGIGKTTLMTMLNNMTEIKGLFEIVIWVTVSKSWSISNLQDVIANRLQLDITNKPNGTRKSDDEVSSMLLRELESKKFLLLLDDVWKGGVDLGKLGIPISNKEKGWKIVLTTRELGVCREMETDKEVKVETLSEGEAWQIFYSKVGETAMWPIINPIAKEIVKECGGLPLALNVVGGALRKVQDVAVWQNRLKKLKAPFISLAKHPSDRVFEKLKVSYEELNDTNIQNCFLYCGLYPEDHRIIKSELIAYWRAEGIIPSSGRGTLKDALNEGLEVLHDLTDASLLDKCKDADDKHVKMHDVIRDLVLKMTSSGGETRQIVRAGLLSEEETIVEDKEWEEATRISFMFNKCALKLPEMPNCPKLSSLLLQSARGRRSELYEIPKSFFNQMPKLRVLDLSYTSISSLPCSISNLVNLRALFLKCCPRLEALPHEVNLLKCLEVICVQRSSMEAMPAEMFELSSLKVLQFSFVHTRWWRKFIFGRVIFPTNAKEISQLSELEEVSVMSHLDEMSVMSHQDEWSHQSVEVIAKEVGKLPRLSSLEFNFGTVNNLLHFLHSSNSWRDNKLTEFLFVVGIGVAVDLLDDHDYLKERWKRCLIYGGRGGDGSGSTSTGSILPSAIKEVLSRSRFFFLCNHGEVKKPFIDLGGVETTSGLRCCRFENCDGLENFLDEDGLRVGAFANLEILKLDTLRNLRSICECYQSPVKQLRAANSLASLGQLEIRGCHKLKNVLPRRLVPLLLALESLEIWNCKGIEEVFSCEEENDDQYELPKLKILEFGYLPELVGYSKLGKGSLHCPMLEKISLCRCPKLKASPFGFSGAPNLKIDRWSFL